MNILGFSPLNQVSAHNIDFNNFTVNTLEVSTLLTLPPNSLAISDTFGLQTKLNEIDVNTADILILQGNDSTHDSNISTLQTTSDTHNSRMLTLESTDDTHSSQIASNQQTTNEHVTHISDLQTLTASHILDIASNTLNTTINSSQIISNINTLASHSTDISVIESDILTLYSSKQPLIGANDLSISMVSNLQTELDSINSLNTSQNINIALNTAIGVANDNALNLKQDIIGANDLSISMVSNLQTELDSINTLNTSQNINIALNTAIGVANDNAISLKQNLISASSNLNMNNINVNGNYEHYNGTEKVFEIRNNSLGYCVLSLFHLGVVKANISTNTGSYHTTNGVVSANTILGVSQVVSPVFLHDTTIQNTNPLASTQKSYVDDQLALKQDLIIPTTSLILKTLQVGTVNGIIGEGNMVVEGNIIAGGVNVISEINTKQDELISSSNIAIQDINCRAIVATSTFVGSSFYSVSPQDGGGTSLTRRDFVEGLVNAKQNVIGTNDLTIGMTANLQTALDSKNDTLIAGTNITIVGNTISSSGGGSSSLTASAPLTITSNNLVVTTDSSPTTNSNNLISSGSVKTAFDNLKTITAHHIMYREFGNGNGGSAWATGSFGQLNAGNVIQVSVTGSCWKNNTGNVNMEVWVNNNGWQQIGVYTFFFNQGGVHALFPASFVYTVPYNDSNNQFMCRMGSGDGSVNTDANDRCRMTIILIK